MANYDDNERLETIDDDDEEYYNMDFKDEDSLGDDMEVRRQKKFLLFAKYSLKNQLKFNVRSTYTSSQTSRISRTMMNTTKWVSTASKISRQALKVSLAGCSVSMNLTAESAMRLQRKT